MSEKKRNEVPDPELTAEEKAARIPTWAPWWPSPRGSELTAAKKAAHVPLEPEKKTVVPERELTEKEKAEWVPIVFPAKTGHCEPGWSERSEREMLASYAKAGLDDAKEHAARKAAGTLYAPDDGIVFPDGDDCLNDYLTPEELAEQKAERVAEQRARLALKAEKDKKP